MAVPGILARMAQAGAKFGQAGGKALHTGAKAGRAGAAGARRAAQGARRGGRAGRAAGGGARQAGRRPLGLLRPRRGPSPRHTGSGRGGRGRPDLQDRRKGSGNRKRPDQQRRPRRNNNDRGRGRPGGGLGPTRPRGRRPEDEPGTELDPATRADRGLAHGWHGARIGQRVSRRLGWRSLRAGRWVVGAWRRPFRLVLLTILMVVVVPCSMVVGTDGIPASGGASGQQGVASVLRFRLPQVAELTGIPVEALDAYLSASTAYEVDWAILAAIGSKECNHYRGNCRRPTVNNCGARGPMQFLGNTWRRGTDPPLPRESDGDLIHCPGSQHFTGDPIGRPVPAGDEGNGYATDANADTVADPWQWHDATHSAARKLVHDGVKDNPEAALLGYNPSQRYVDAVISIADDYREDVASLDLGTTGLADANGSGGGATSGECHVLGSTERYTDSRITATTQRLLDAVIPCFGRGHWRGCFRSGGGGDHPRGRACDFAPGPLDQRPTPAQADHGTRLAEWLVANAGTYDVNYVIWERRIWDADEAERGWQPYTRYSDCRPQDCVRLWHYDHVHVSVY